MTFVFPMFWAQVPLGIPALTPQEELQDNDGVFLQDNDGVQLVDNTE